MALPQSSPAPSLPLPAVPSSTPGGTGSLQDRLDRIETNLQLLHNYTAYPITNEPGPSITSTTPVIVGGITIPWAMLRPILQMPDWRWDAWASGWLINGSGTTTLAMYYQDDGVATHSMGSTTFPTQGTFKKVAIGPFPVRGTMAAQLGAPQGEHILSIGVMANVSAGTAILPRWTLWIRQSPTRS
jgi:hypothetical protein